MAIAAMKAPWSQAELDTLRQAVMEGAKLEQLRQLLPGRTGVAIETRMVMLRRAGQLPALARTGAAAPRHAEPARPGSNLDRLLRFIRDCAARGEALPSSHDLAERLNLSDRTHANRLMAEAQARGLVVVEYGPQGPRRVSAPDGAWSVTGAAYAGRQGGRRRCLCCGNMFEPAHRTNFVCGGCKATTLWNSGA